MPSHQQTLPINNQQHSLAIALQAINELEWKVVSVSSESIVAHTKKDWKTYGQQVTINVEGQEMLVKSEMINGELIDVSGKNSKNTESFINSFLQLKESVNAGQLQDYSHSYQVAVENTFKETDEKIRQAVTLDQAMNLSAGNANITYAIIAVNIIIFILMAVNGAKIFAPDGFMHISWGSNYTPLTLSGDWWRLLTNIFLHFGIIHLLMNMYCLYTVGVYLEPMLGKVKYITAYLCTGVLASVGSLWWHNEGVNSAGASGAIFGLYGLFLSLLTTKLIPEFARKSLLQNIGIFIAYNLIYGMKSGIDNAAHIGGAVSGFIIGYLYAYTLSKEKQGNKIQWVIPSVILVTVFLSGIFLHQNKVATEQRQAALNNVKAASYKDNDEFNEKLSQFDKENDVIYKAISGDTLTDQQMLTNIKEKGFGAIEHARNIIQSTVHYDISDSSHEKANLLLKYLDLRKKEFDIIEEMIEQNKTNELMPQLQAVRNEYGDVFQQALKK